MKKTLLTLSFLFLGISVSNSAGFRLADQSAAAAAMGNAFVAVANDVSAVWYNPAAIVNLEGTQLSAGSVMIYPLMKHEYSTGSDKPEKILHIPPHFYATHKYSEAISFGLGINAPFGLSTDWDKTTSPTRSIATYSEIIDKNINFNTSYKLNEQLSFAAGLNYAMIDATLNKWYIPVSGEQTLVGDGTGSGYNAALLYKHNDIWSFGVNYRSKIKVKLKGIIKFGTVSSYDDAKTELTLPDMLQIGAAYKHNDKWLFSAEADYTNWTTYRQIDINWNNNTASSSDIKNWKSVWAFRLGTEYKYSDAWKFRGGFFYDNNPIKEKRYDTRMPDADRLAFSIGAGYTKNNITIDIMYQYVKFMDRTIDDSLQDGAGTILNGDYKSSAHLPGITVGYKF